METSEDRSARLHNLKHEKESLDSSLVYSKMLVNEGETDYHLWFTVYFPMPSFRTV